jgi:hypothetical protein
MDQFGTAGFPEQLENDIPELVMGCGWRVGESKGRLEIMG